MDKSQSAPLLHNIELKARCNDLPGALATVRQLSPIIDTGVQQQIDTYFLVTHGRLKLREIVGVKSELIWYDRADQAISRKSDYRVTPISHPDSIKASLCAALDVAAQVVKNRHVLLWHNVRIHLDQVQGLGSFIEFEAVIGKQDDEVLGHNRLKYLCEILNIKAGDLVDRSYADL